jgi:hypothetical protein
MTIELSTEEARFIKQAVQLAVEISHKMKAKGHDAADVAAKAIAVSNSVLAKMDGILTTARS